jgi:hypothetical protein
MSGAGVYRNYLTTQDLIVLLAVALFLYLWHSRRSQRLKYPPGPPSDPFIGHLRYLPSTEQERTFATWGEQYGARKSFQFMHTALIKVTGDIVYVHCLGKKILVLNSVEAAHDLLDKRSAIYSDRPRSVVFGEL